MFNKIIDISITASIVIFCVLALVFAALLESDKHACREIAVMLEKETWFISPTCYVKVDDTVWLPVDVYLDNLAVRKFR